MPNNFPPTGNVMNLEQLCIAEEKKKTPEEMAMYIKF